MLRLVYCSDPLKLPLHLLLPTAFSRASGEQWLHSLISFTEHLNDQFLRVSVTECLLHCGRSVIIAMVLYSLADLLSATDSESKIMWFFCLFAGVFFGCFQF